MGQKIANKSTSVIEIRNGASSKAAVIKVEEDRNLLPRGCSLRVINNERDSALLVLDEGHRCDGEVVALDGHVRRLDAFLHLEPVLQKKNQTLFIKFNARRGFIK